MLATDENIEAVKKIILDNSLVTIARRAVADDFGISFGSCQAIFLDVCMKSAAAKIVLKLLNFEQKQHRIDIAQMMLTAFNDDPGLLKNVITGDESWVYGYDIARQVRSNVKVLLTVCFDCIGVVHSDFLPQDRTLNKEYYLEVMSIALSNSSEMHRIVEKSFMDFAP